MTTPKRTAEIPVINDDNLHLRPIQVFTEKAVGFESRISIRRGAKQGDAKSILDVMLLAAEKGPLLLEADGADAEAAIAALEALLNQELNKR